MLWKLPLVARRSTEGTRQGSHLPPASSTRKRPRGGEGPAAHTLGAPRPHSASEPGSSGEGKFLLPDDASPARLALITSCCRPRRSTGRHPVPRRQGAGLAAALLEKPETQIPSQAHTCTCAHMYTQRTPKRTQQTHMHTCVLNAHSNTHVHTCSHTPHACSHAHMHEHATHTHIHMHARALTHTHTLTLNTSFHARVCSHMHTRTPMHMHSHAHTYTSEPGSAHTHSTRMHTCLYAHICS